MPILIALIFLAAMIAMLPWILRAFRTQEKPADKAPAKGATRETVKLSNGKDLHIMLL